MNAYSFRAITFKCNRIRNITENNYNNITGKGLVIFQQNVLGTPVLVYS